MRIFTTAFLVLALAGSTVPVSSAEASGTPPVVSKFLSLFEELRAAQIAKEHGTNRHVAFEISDTEINQYFAYSLHATPRPGVDSFTAKIFPSNYISTFTVVDFDAVERWHPGTIPTLLRPVLSGKKSIWIDYRIQANNYKMTFSVEKSYYQDVRLPAFVVDKIIAAVAARQPEKYDTSKPIPIPFGLKDISTTDHVIHGAN